jgi:hypothetical protein
VAPRRAQPSRRSTRRSRRSATAAWSSPAGHCA